MDCLPTNKRKFKYTQKLNAMKLLLILLLIFFNPGLIHAQTWDEWFKQKKTQKKYLQDQIAALQTYMATAEKGYKIVSDGIHTIANIKNGEFNLHTLFFSSLKTVNSNIKNAAIVAEIIAYGAAVIEKFKTVGKQNLNNDEIAYISNVYSHILTASLQDINALTDVITDGKLQLSDDERMQRIAELHNSMWDKYQFAQSFVNDASLLSVQRQQSVNDIIISQQLYHIK